jgi:hypothetical protein
MKAYRGSRGIALLFFFSPIDESERLGLCPGRFNPGKQTRYPLDGRVGVASYPVRTFRKTKISIFSNGIRTPNRLARSVVVIMSVLLRLHLYPGFHVLFVDFAISINVELCRVSLATPKFNSEERWIDLKKINTTLICNDLNFSLNWLGLLLHTPTTLVWHRALWYKYINFRNNLTLPSSSYSIRNMKNRYSSITLVNFYRIPRCHSP